MAGKFARFLLYCVVFLLVMGGTAYFTLHFMLKTTGTVVVPDLRGKDAVHALGALSGIGLNTKVTGSDFSASVPKDHVLYQDPEPGSQIKKDRDVRLVLSAGPSTFSMPDFTGLDLRKAGLALEDNGLAMGRVVQLHDPSGERDTIVAQAPMAGQTLTKGGQVDFVISLGPQPVFFQMPKVTGLPFDQAVRAIEQTGLFAGSVESGEDPGKARETVLEQTPPGGYPVEYGARVTLVVNRPAGTAGGPDLFRAPPRFVQVFVPPGILKSRVRLRTGASGGMVDMYDRHVRPGETVWIALPKGGRATWSLTRDGQRVLTGEDGAARQIRLWLDQGFPAERFSRIAPRGVN